MGTHGRNGDALVMTEEGVIKGGSLKRTPEEKRWSKEGFEKLRGTRWNLRPQRAEDLDAAIRIELPEVGPGRLMPEPADREAGLTRNLYVKKKDVEGNFTPGCAGCNAIQVGLPIRSHSAECRTLVAQRLLLTEEGKERVMRAQKRKGIVEEAPGERADVMLPDLLDDADRRDACTGCHRPASGQRGSSRPNVPAGSERETGSSRLNESAGFGSQTSIGVVGIQFSTTSSEENEVT